jgi:hypothetical protein
MALAIAGAIFCLFSSFGSWVPVCGVLSWCRYVSTENYRVFTRSLAASLVPATEQAVCRASYVPPTATGIAEPVPGWPLPSCPKALFPQHQARPSVSTPQVWASPAFNSLNR